MPSALCDATYSLRGATDPPSGRLIAATEIRFSEIIAAHSVALDITQGQPAGHCMRSALIGMRLAEVLRLSSADRSALFYALLLKDLGCSSNAAKMAYLFGADDRAVKQTARLIDWTKPGESIKHCWTQCSPGGSMVEKLLKMAAMVRNGPDGARKISQVRCERGADIARACNCPKRPPRPSCISTSTGTGAGFRRGSKGRKSPCWAGTAVATGELGAMSGARASVQGSVEGVANEVENELMNPSFRLGPATPSPETACAIDGKSPALGVCPLATFRPPPNTQIAAKKSGRDRSRTLRAQDGGPPGHSPTRGPRRPRRDLGLFCEPPPFATHSRIPRSFQPSAAAGSPLSSDSIFSVEALPSDRSASPVIENNCYNRHGDRIFGTVGIIVRV